MRGISVAVVILSLAWAISAEAQTGSWAEKFPGPRLHLHGVVASGGHLYAYGGRYVTPSGTYRFDPVINSWFRLTDMPAANWGFGAAAYGGTCYAFGNGSSASGAIYAYNTATGIWTTLSTTLGVARRLSAAAVIGDRIYICGGRLANNAYTSAVEEFDPLTGTLRSRAALPAPAANGMVGTVDGRLYFAGGFDAAGSRLTTYEYDPGSNSWTPRAGMPWPRHGAAAFVVGRRLFVAGGADGASTFLDDCIEYSPAANVWTARAPLPSPGARYGFGGCSIAGKGYVFGGRNSLSADTSTPDFDACQEFTPPAVGVAPSDPLAPTVRTATGRPLSPGDATNESTLDFSVTASDPDGSEAALEVEVGPATPGPITPTYRVRSALQPNGVLTVRVPTIAEGSWAWRCRVWDADDNGNPGGWIRFGQVATDFTVDFTLPSTPTGLSPSETEVRFPTSTPAIPPTEFTWSNPVESDVPVDHEIWVVELRRDLQLYDVGKWIVNGSPAYVPLPANPLNQYWSVRSRDRAGNVSSWSPPLRFRVYQDDGITHAGGDADRVLGCSATTDARPGAAAVLALLGVLAAVMGRRRAVWVALLCATMISCGQEAKKDSDPSPAVDITPPAVAATDPADGADGVMPNPSVSITFSEPVQLWTAAAAFNLTADGFDVPCNGVLAGSTVTFTPAAGVPAPAYPANYLARLDPGVRDLSGNATSLPYEWSFTSVDGAWMPTEVVDGGIGYVSSPQVAVDGAGNSIAIWAQNDGALWDDAVARRRLRDAGWESATTIESLIGYATVPQICANESGVSFAIWLHDGTVYSNRFAPGAGWGTAESIQGPAGTCTQPQIAMDAAGNAIASWFRGTEVWTNRYINGTGWGAAQNLGSYASFLHSMRIAMNASGSAVVTWVQNANPGYTLRALRFSPTIGWGLVEPIRVPSSGAIGAAQVAMDSEGAIIAVWSESAGGIYSMWSRRFVAAEGWKSPEVLETDDGGNAINPQIQMDGDGNALVLWQQALGGPVRIVANRFDSSSGDWSGANPIHAPTENASRARLAVDRAGNAIAVWTQTAGSTANLWTSRYLAGEGWSEPALLEADDVNPATGAQIAMNPSGVAAVIWLQADADGLLRVQMRRFE